ncbi:MAG: fibronectin type III domain-containing protein [Uliginosibacterium sp.]|nr:fibronectin type III domain-containing protein [Uliginosibacterium sp.]
MFVRRNLCSLSLALLCATGLAGCGGGGGGEEDRGTVENSGTVTDTTAPSVPTSVMVMDTAERSVQLAWSAASDDVGVTGYEILRDGQVVGSTAADVLNYTDTGLVDGVNYIYHVRARDGRGNVSAPSVDLRVVARSNADKRPPSPPSGLQQQGGTSTSITLSWQAASDNVGVTGYEIVRNGLQYRQHRQRHPELHRSRLVSGARYSYVIACAGRSGQLVPLLGRPHRQPQQRSGAGYRRTHRAQRLEGRRHQPGQRGTELDSRDRQCRGDSL